MIRYSLSAMQGVRHIRLERATRLRWQVAASVLIVAALLMLRTSPGFGQASAQEQARVPTSHAAIHDAPTTASVMMLMVPEGTVLPVIGRQGEWVQVQLSPELRETSIVLRWYEGRHDIVQRGEVSTIGDENTGWMHDSTVEISAAGSR